MGDQVTQSTFDHILQEQDIFKKAQSILKLKEEQGIRLVDISKGLKLKPSYVSHILRLNKLPPLVIDGYYSNTVSPTHLYVIARLKNHDQMIAAYEHVLAHNLAVQETEILVRTVLYGLKGEGEYLQADERRVFEVAMRQLGIEATVIQSRIRSKLTLEVKGDLLKTSVLMKDIMQLLQTKLKDRVQIEEK